MSAYFHTKKFTIANAATQSTDEVALEGLVPVAFAVPSGYVGGTSLTCQGAVDATDTYVDITDGADGTTITQTIAASKIVALQGPVQAALMCAPYLKISVNSAVTGDQEISLICRTI